MTAVAYRRQIFALQLIGPEQRDRAAAEALHGEGEVRETVVPGKNFTGKTERPYVQLLGRSAIGSRDNGFQPARFAKRAHELATAAIHVSVIDQRRDFSIRPAGKLRREAAMPVVEKRPIEMRQIQHQRPPPDRSCCGGGALLGKMKGWG